MKNYIVKVQFDEADEQKLREHFIGANAEDSIADILTICIESNSEDMFIVDTVQEEILYTFINDELEGLYADGLLQSFAERKSIRIEKEILNNGWEVYNLTITDHEGGDEDETEIVYETLQEAEADAKKIFELCPQIRWDRDYVHATKEEGYKPYKFDNGELGDDIAKSFFNTDKQYDATIAEKRDDGRRGKTWELTIVSEDGVEKEYEYYSEEAAIADCEELVLRCENVNES